MPIYPGASTVFGEGPAPARIAVYGEAPGAEENFKRRPFIGKAGAILNMLLLWEGIDRSEVFVSNLVKHWTGPHNPDPDEADIRRDAPLLLAEIARVQPEVVLAMGRFAASYFLGQPVNMDAMHGLAHASKRFGGLVVVPVYHPAAGLHQPHMSALSYLGMKGAGEYLRGQAGLWTEKDAPVRMRVIEPRAKLVIAEDAAIDTEGTPERPFSVQYSTSADAEVFVRAEHAHHLEFRGRCIFHNAHYDVRMLRAMGVRFPADPRHWEDTMVRAYVRSDQPQGLKPLAYRLLGRKLTDFDDVAKPHFDRLASAYLERIVVRGARFPRPARVRLHDGERWQYYQAQTPRNRAKGLLRAWSKDSSTDLAAGWKNLPDESRLAVEADLGPFPSYGIECVPLEQSVGYGILDSVCTRQLAKEYRVPRALTAVYRQDVDIIPTLIEMEDHGLPFSTEAAADLCAELEDEVKDLRRVLCRLAGNPFLNPGSPPQVRTVLFDQWGAEGSRTTKLTGADSTDDRTLSTLALQYANDRTRAGKRIHEFVRTLQDWRERRKLIGTYVGPSALPSQCVDGRVHTTLKATFVASGRLSSEAPNLQNIPTRTELGQRIRKCFRAEDGHCLLSADLSQIELRMAAHESGDPALIKVFREGQDLHRITERDIMGVDDAHAGEKRGASKNFNFRVLYAGPKGSPRGLREQLFLDGVDLLEDECARYRDGWFALYPGVARYLEKQAEDARLLGYASTSGGRRRYLPLVRADGVRGVQAEAERQAGNHGIQGKAAEVLKAALVRWHRGYRERAQRIVECKLVLQIHDELMLDVGAPADDPRVRSLAALMVEMLTADSDQYAVPILAECKAGASWGEQEKVA